RTYSRSSALVSTSLALISSKACSSVSSPVASAFFCSSSMTSSAKRTMICPGTCGTASALRTLSGSAGAPVAERASPAPRPDARISKHRAIENTAERPAARTFISRRLSRKCRTGFDEVHVATTGIGCQEARRRSGSSALPSWPGSRALAGRRSGGWKSSGMNGRARPGHNGRALRANGKGRSCRVLGCVVEHALVAQLLKRADQRAGLILEQIAEAVAEALVDDLFELVVRDARLARQREEVLLLVRRHRIATRSRQRSL